MTKLFRRLAIAVLGLLFISVLLTGGCQEHVIYNGTRDEAPRQLPADATRIHSYIPPVFYPDTYYEFDTTEESFLSWVQGLPTVEDTLGGSGGPFGFARYGGYGPNPDDRWHVEIASGYLYGWSEEDRGEHYAYDLDAGRAYYHRHTR